MNTATPILIRPLRADEAPALRALFHAAVHGLACRDYTPDQLNAWAPLAHDAAQWAARLQANQPWVAEVAGSAAGFADVSLTAEPFFARHGFAVEARQQVERHGVVLRNTRMAKLLAGNCS